MADTVVARASPGRKATPKVGRFQPAPGTPMSTASDSGDDGAHDYHGERGDRGGLAALDALIRELPGAHPWNERADHPPDRVIPPVAPAADLEPSVGVRADVLEDADVDQKKDDRGRESDARRARDALDGACASPEPWEKGDRSDAGEQDDREYDGLDRAGRQEARGEGEDEDGHGLDQSELDRAADDRGDIGNISCRVKFHRRVHAPLSEMGVDEGIIPKRASARPRGWERRYVPHASTTATSVTAQAASARYILR